MTEEKRDRIAKKAYRAVDRIIGEYEELGIADSGFISMVKLRTVDHRSVEISVLFGGLPNRPTKVLPVKYRTDRPDDMEMVRIILDEIEIFLAERLTGWRNISITILPDSSVVCDNRILETFVVRREGANG